MKKELSKADKKILSRHMEFRFPDKEITLKSKVYFNGSWYRFDTIPFGSEHGYYRFIISKIEAKK